MIHCMLYVAYGVSPLYARIMNFTNYYSGYGLQPEGQEDFTIIQYDVSDQYKYVRTYIILIFNVIH